MINVILWLLTWILGSSWWPRVLWQAVTLWFVNRGWPCVEVGRSSRCVTGRRPHDKRTTQSDLDSQASQNRESNQEYAADQRRLWHLWRYGLQWEYKRWHPLAPGRRRYGARSPLSEYMSLYLSLKLITNCGPLSRIKLIEIYFYQEVCFVRSLKFVHYHWLCSWLCLWEVYNINIKSNY